MTIGLLICDYVREKYQRKHGDYPRMFRTLFPDISFIDYFVIDGHFPLSVNECDAYICTGSSYSVYQDIPWIHELAEFIRDLDREQIKFVGVCFGHQMIGLALGGSVEKSNNGWCVGLHCFDIEASQPWMHSPADKLNVLMMCQDQITVLPQSAQRIASTALCPIAMIQIGTHMIGIQGHPEFTKEYDRALMEDRIEIMGIDVVKAGLDSLDQTLDRNLLKQWIKYFLSN